MNNNSDQNVLAPELNLKGLGLSYDDIQRGKTGDFDHVREKVRRKGKRSVLWGRTIALVLSALFVVVMWVDGFKSQNLPSLWSIAIIIGFFLGLPWYANQQETTLETRIAAANMSN